MENRQVYHGKASNQQFPLTTISSDSGDTHLSRVRTSSDVPGTMDKQPPSRSSTTSSGNKSVGGGGGAGGTHWRLGGLSKYLMKKAQSNDSGLDLSPATLQTLVHPLRSSTSGSTLHVRNLFESPASSDESPIPSNEVSKSDSEADNAVPSTPHVSNVSRSVLSEFNSSESTVIEKTITDEPSSKDIVKESVKDSLSSKVTNDRSSVNQTGSRRANYKINENLKQYCGNDDNITPKDRGFQVPYGNSTLKKDKSKTRISSGVNENFDPSNIGGINAGNHHKQQLSNSHGNFSSDIAAVIASEHAKKSQTGAALLQTPKPKSTKKKAPIAQTCPKKQTGWKFLSEHVQDKEFLILEQLGKGGCGEVSLVMEKGTRKQYALKVVQLHGIDDSSVQECINEVEMLIDLKGSDLVVDIHSWEFNRTEKTMKILMEKGQCDLHQTVQKAHKTKKPIKLLKLKYIWESLLIIVEKIHSRGIVHADLKPANFVWFEDSLKIIDFGIASRLQSDLTSIAMPNPKGTLNFISPEIIRQDESGRSKLSPKSDIWALGCILYFLVYGRSPFENIGHTVAKMNAILQGDIVYPTLPPHLHGSDVTSVLKLCFQLDYKRRPSAAELLKHRFLNS